jgi:hypothetical protein
MIVVGNPLAICDKPSVSRLRRAHNSAYTTRTHSPMPCALIRFGALLVKHVPRTSLSPAPRSSPSASSARVLRRADSHARRFIVHFSFHLSRFVSESTA